MSMSEFKDLTESKRMGEIYYQALKLSIEILENPKDVAEVSRDVYELLSEVRFFPVFKNPENPSECLRIGNKIVKLALNK